MVDPKRLVDDNNDSEVKRLLLAAKHDGPSPSAETKQRVQTAVLAHFRAQRSAPRSGLRKIEHATNEPPGTTRHDKPISMTPPKKERTWVTRVFAGLAAAAMFATIALVTHFTLDEDQRLTAPTTAPSNGALATTSDAGSSLLHIALDPDAGLESLTPEERARAAVERMGSRLGVAGRVSPHLSVDAAPQVSASAAPSQQPPKTPPPKTKTKSSGRTGISFGD